MGVLTHNIWDVIVVGGGHAGIEAALAAARLGARCALVTHAASEMGRMPCNPAIGGLGKGHLVREIDVLGGEMGLAIDETGIQFRMLNTKKGPAVRSPRAQADKHAYQRRMGGVVREQAGLTVIEGDAMDILVAPPRTPGAAPVARGVRLADGREIAGSRVILGSGTFMRGLMHVGAQQTTGGREGAHSAEGLSESLRRLGFALKRLKTGTPPRLARDSIDYSALQSQAGDENPTPFSLRSERFAPQQIACHLVWTNERTHDLIRANLGRSPLFAGAIEGQGPRYCPSIEDKIVRFADKDRHLLFLEPEGIDDDEVYVNGLSTSLPADVQQELVHSMPGLERARIVRYGYAVEYDSVPSWQTNASLESQPVAGLYLAGQVLGTSGYEEAAAQGLMAGLNAVRSLDGAPALVLGRDQAYLGVLVDDLVTKDISEPYRMFTSRAEHRLHLRCDNAEERLGPLAVEIGLLPERGRRLLAARAAYVAGLAALLAGAKVRPPEGGSVLSAAQLLRFPSLGLHDVLGLAAIDAAFADRLEGARRALAETTRSPHVRTGAEAQVENGIKYGGYIAKQERLLSSREHLDHCELPAEIDYTLLKSLSFEAREKLTRVRPVNLGQAGRIDGVRAGDLAVLAVYLKKARALAGADESEGHGEKGA